MLEEYDIDKLHPRRNPYAAIIQVPPEGSKTSQDEDETDRQHKATSNT